jgi:hypothetical protein
MRAVDTLVFVLALAEATWVLATVYELSSRDSGGHENYSGMRVFRQVDGR